VTVQAPEYRDIPVQYSWIDWEAYPRATVAVSKLRMVDCYALYLYAVRRGNDYFHWHNGESLSFLWKLYLVLHGDVKWMSCRVNCHRLGYPALLYDRQNCALVMYGHIRFLLFPIVSNFLILAHPFLSPFADRIETRIIARVSFLIHSQEYL
jgi:hypothetical protein